MCVGVLEPRTDDGILLILWDGWLFEGNKLVVPLVAVVVLLWVISRAILFAAFSSTDEPTRGKSTGQGRRDGSLVKLNERRRWLVLIELDEVLDCCCNDDWAETGGLKLGTVSLREGVPLFWVLLVDVYVIVDSCETCGVDGCVDPGRESECCRWSAGTDWES